MWSLVVDRILKELCEDGSFRVRCDDDTVILINGEF
jgi:hypothetical protein